MKNYTLKRILQLILIFLPVLLLLFSFTAQCKADETGVLVYITTPANASYLHTLPNNKVNIVGSAYLNSGFINYQLYYAPKDDSAKMTAILTRPATTMIRDSSLCFWDTTGIADGEYLLILKVKTANSELSDSKNITIDNQNDPPVFVNLHNQATAAGMYYRLKIQAKDPDDPATPQGKLTYGCMGANSIPGFRFYPGSQTVTWYPSEQNKGQTYRVIFTVRDNDPTHTVTKLVNFTIIDIKEEKLHTFSTLQEFSYPVLIYGEKIAWSEDGPERGTYIYDLSTNQKTKLLAFYSLVDLYQNKLLSIARSTNGRDSFVVYDLLTKIEQASAALDSSIAGAMVLEDNGGQANRVIWNSGLVNGKSALNYYTFLGAGSGGSNIATGNILANGYDLVPGKNTVVFGDKSSNGGIFSSTIAYNSYPTKLLNVPTDLLCVPDENKIVFADYRRGTDVTDLRMFDTKTKQLSEIAWDIGIGPGLAAAKDRVVYSNEKPITANIYTAGIYLYIPSKDTEIRVVQLVPGAKHSLPRIFGNKIVWMNAGNIYLERVTFPPKMTAITPLTVKSGTLLTIKGTDFGDRQSESQVQFENKALAEIQSWSDTEITCKVPKEAATGLVKVINPAGVSNGIKVVVEGLALPLPPVSLSVSAVFSYQVDLTWDYNANLPGAEKITKFMLTRRDLTLNQQSEEIINNNLGVSMRNYSDYTAKKNTNYRYRVYSAIDDNLYEACGSNYLDVLTPEDPNLPKNLTAAVVSPTEIKLTWQGNYTMYSIFVVERNTKEDFSELPSEAGRLYYQDKNTVPATHAFTDTNLRPNTKYYFRVYVDYGSGGYGKKDYSNVVSATTPALSIPELTLIPFATNIIKINVKYDKDFEEVEIERSIYPDKGFEKVSFPPYFEKYDRGLKENTTYYYRSRAKAGGEFSAYSPVVSVTTLSLPAPSNLRLEHITGPNNTYGAVKVTWQDNTSGTAGFVIAAKMKDGTDFQEMRRVNKGENSCLVELKELGGPIYMDSEWSIRVGAFLSRGMGQDTIGVPCEIFDYSIPAIGVFVPQYHAPKINARPLSSQAMFLNFSFDGLFAFDRLEIERSLYQDFRDIQLVPPGNFFSLDTGLKAGTTYYYRCRAFYSKASYHYARPDNDYNRYGPYSNVVNATTLEDKAVPLNFKATITGKTSDQYTVTLSWTNNSGMKDYYALRKFSA
ncbi:MAG: fibronectin type III domain-containing protein, partial [Candidatus Omnitrophica bacterium]|nr:fibronectin type III domain-containing protein [Candidatus Omnitrophota bacterium]